MSQKTQISRRSDVSLPPVPGQAPAPAPQAENSFYTQSAGAPEGRTFIPGMKRKSYDAAPQAEEAPSQTVRLDLQSRPLAGVLYSVSRNSLGEIFPVYIGRNSIGSQPVSDIYLSEKTVSPEHALLLIRKLSLPDGTRRVTMSISDYSTEYGTKVNDQCLDEDVVEIQSGDTLQIGRAYRFVFIPLDAEQYDLFTATNFEATPRVENRPTVNADYQAYMEEPVDTTVYPDAVGEEDEMTFYGRSQQKKEDHSSKKTL